MGATIRKILTGLSALALTAGLGACATVTRGTSEQFTINTTPPGAQAHTSSGFNCESTPCAIRMPRKDSFTITVTKAGYKTVATDIKPHVAETGGAAFVGNALIGGVIGAAVDVGSGATMDLGPNPLNITLVAVDAPAMPVSTPTAVPPPPAPGTVAVATPAKP
jgi:hypothetical protein